MGKKWLKSGWFRVDSADVTVHYRPIVFAFKLLASTPVVVATHAGDNGGGSVNGGREGSGNRRCGREEERERVSGLG